MYTLYWLLLGLFCNKLIIPGIDVERGIAEIELVSREEVIKLTEALKLDRGIIAF